MKKKPTNLVVRFCSYFDDSITTRSAIKKLFNINFSNATSIELNYENIDFISRSAAHQILIETNRIESKCIKVFDSSKSILLSKMFDTIKNYKPKESDIDNNLKIFKTNNKKELNKLILSL